MGTTVRFTLEIMLATLLTLAAMLSIAVMVSIVIFLIGAAVMTLAVMSLAGL